jgi:carboxymethylenebutenolidase
MRRAILLVGALGLAAQAHAQQPAPDPGSAHVHMEAQAPPAAAPSQGPPAPGGGPGGPGAQRGGQPQTPPIEVPWNDAIPAGTPEHAARALKESTRHGEWVDIKMKDGSPLKAWVVYPERPNKTGVVLVIHDIFGMRDLPRAVGDQLAQDGFIAIVPDFLSGKGPNGGGSDSLGSGVNQAIMSLSPADVIARLDAAMEYGKGLPASNGKTGVIGFCWGGGRSFGYAAAQPALSAAVVYYGDAPGASAPGATADTVAAQLANVKAPVLGLYAGNDARIGATIPVTEAAMKKNGKSYEVHTYEGAGHGFMGQQAGAGGANLKAAEQSWPLVVQFFTKNLQ